MAPVSMNSRARRRVARVLPGTRARDEREVLLVERVIPGYELVLPSVSAVSVHLPPFSRLQAGQSACPSATSVTCVRRNGVMWSPCHPGSSGAPHREHCREPLGTALLAETLRSVALSSLPLMSVHQIHYRLMLPTRLQRQPMASQ